MGALRRRGLGPRLSALCVALCALHAVSAWAGGASAPIAPRPALTVEEFLASISGKASEPQDEADSSVEDSRSRLKALFEKDRRPRERMGPDIPPLDWPPPEPRDVWRHDSKARPQDRRPVGSALDFLSRRGQVEAQVSGYTGRPLSSSYQSAWRDERRYLVPVSPPGPPAQRKPIAGLFAPRLPPMHASQPRSYRRMCLTR